jgi:hypothetical protein
MFDDDDDDAGGGYGGANFPGGGPEAANAGT